MQHIILLSLTVHHEDNDAPIAKFTITHASSAEIVKNAGEFIVLDNSNGIERKYGFNCFPQNWLNNHPKCTP